ncbi:MAG: hypothetical protein SAK42_23550, partial [Oscillatoria sp. PMC 1076.18]|nr:hypothetical protein [Oscillatoria sp. PMC 1076.18]
IKLIYKEDEIEIFNPNLIILNNDRQRKIVKVKSTLRHLLTRSKRYGTLSICLTTCRKVTNAFKLKTSLLARLLINRI